MYKTKIMENSKLVSIYGQVRELLLPSGVTAVIREQNGEDDALLSNVTMGRNFDSLNAFISSITVSLSSSANPAAPPTIEEIMIRPIRDKYFLLIASRIFSLGPNLEFDYQWDPNLPKIHYVEELGNYLWDYNNPIPKVGEPGYFAERIKPYPVKGLFVEAVIGDKKIRFNLLNSYGEKYLLKLPDTERHINQQLLARDLSILDETGQYTKVTNFRNFKSPEMAKLRALIMEWDEDFNGLTTLENPYNTSQVEEVSIIQIPDFFFPKA